MALAAALIMVALLVASYRVGSLYLMHRVDGGPSGDLMMVESKKLFA